MDLVDDESKIIVDVFVCGAPDAVPEITEIGKTYTNFMRKRTIRSYYLSTDSIVTSMAAHPKVQMRYVVKQGDSFTGLDEIKFDGEYTWSAQMTGR